MKSLIFVFVVTGAVAFTSPLLSAEEKPAAPPKKEEKKDASKEVDRDAEKLKKEVEGYTKRLKGETAKKLWEIVSKGSDDDLKATGLKAEVIETLKSERPNLKGWPDVLTNDKLGRQVLKDLTDYGASSKFTKILEDEEKQKDKKEKDKEREQRKARKEREKSRDKDP